MANYTNKMICITCLDLLNEKPLDKITVKELVSKCHTNRNTFYYHFKDIYHVIEEIFRHEKSKLIEKQSTSTTFLEAYSMAADVFISHRRAILHIFQSKNSYIIEKYLNDIVEGFISRFVKKRLSELNKSLDITSFQYIVTFYSGPIYKHILDFIHSGMTERQNGLMINISNSYQMTIDILISQFNYA